MIQQFFKTETQKFFNAENTELPMTVAPSPRNHEKVAWKALFTARRSRKYQNSSTKIKQAPNLIIKGPNPGQSLDCATRFGCLKIGDWNLFGVEATETCLRLRIS